MYLSGRFGGSFHCMKILSENRYKLTANKLILVNVHFIPYSKTFLTEKKLQMGYIFLINPKRIQISRMNLQCD